ncbi:zinc knuckle CX2CX4HX4C containing protein [Tanacetum coccineum]
MNASGIANVAKWCVSEGLLLWSLCVGIFAGSLGRCCVYSEHGKGFFSSRGSVKRKKDENTTQTATNKEYSLADYGNVNNNTNLASFRTRNEERTLDFNVVDLHEALLKSDTCGNNNDMCDGLSKRVAYPFSSKDGMDALIENGPWMIRNVPLILKKWTPDAKIMKEDVCNIPVLVNYVHEFWDRSSYARAMVELRADVDLKDTIVFVVPKFMGEGYTH